MKQTMIAAVVATAVFGSALPATAQESGYAATDPLTCLLVPSRVSEIGSNRGGIVSEVTVRRSDVVEAGAVLVQLDDAIAQSDLEIAVIRRDALRGKLDRSAALIEDRLIPREEVASMETDFALAVADATRAELQLLRTQIVAPYGGVVADVRVSTGELIGADPLLTLIDMSTLHAELVFVTEAYGSFGPGDILEIAIDLTGDTVPAEIIAVDPFFDASSNTFSVLAKIDNAELALPAGASCRIAP